MAPTFSAKLAGFSIWLIFFSLFSSSSGIAIGTALLVVSVLVLYRREFLQATRFPLFWPTILFAGALALSIALAPGAGFAKPLGKIRYLFIYFFIAVYFSRNPLVLEKMSRIAVFLSWLLLVVCSLQFFAGFCPLKQLGWLEVYLAQLAGSGGRLFHARGFLYHHNPFAFGALFLVCLLFGRLVFCSSTKNAWFYFSGLCSLLICIGMSGSRGSWLALVAAFMVWLAFLGRSHWRLFGKLALVAAVLVFSFWGPLSARFSSIRPSENPDRLRLWEISLELFRESPWVGNGYHLGFERGRTRYMSLEEKANPFFPTDPHSLYFDLLATTGILGLTGFLVWLLGALRLYVKFWRQPGLASDDRATILTGVGFLACFAVGSAFDSHFFHTQTLMVTIFALGIGQSVAFRKVLNAK